MKILQVILCLLMVTVLQAQVKTFVIKKAKDFDTQEVTLAFNNEHPIMPQFNGGKKKYDVAVQNAYLNALGKGPKPNIVNASDEAGVVDSSTNIDTTIIQFYEGRPLDKARFIMVKTFCDTGGNILILPQEIPDDYTMMAIAMVRQLPKFIPAYFEGDVVPVYLNIPVRFLNRITDDPKIRDKPGFATKTAKKGSCFFMRWMRRIFHIRAGNRMF